MDFLPSEIGEYVENHTRAEDEVLRTLNRETHLKTEMPQMLSGHLQGQTLRMLSLMLRPKNILEIGTFTGYSAICLSAGLQKGGKLVTIDINEELEAMVRRYFAIAGITEKVDYRIGDATKIIPALDMSFDLVFIDADKENYSLYYDLVFEKLNSGGFIFADNVLWSGKVVKPNPDKETAAIMAFNEKIMADERVDNVLLPIRDGLMLIRKK